MTDSVQESSSGMPISELILTTLRTVLDVVRNINKKRSNHATTVLHPQTTNATTVQVSLFYFILKVANK